MNVPSSPIYSKCVEEHASRRKIVLAAEKVIRAKGYANATTKEIARAAGVAEGTLYNHFVDKFDVFIAALMEARPPFSEQMQELSATLLSKPLPLEKKLARVIRLLLGFYEAIVPLSASILADPELRNRYEEALRVGHRGPGRGVEQLAEYLRQEREQGNVQRGIDLEVVAAGLLSTCFYQVWSMTLTGQTLMGRTQANVATRLAEGAAKVLMVDAAGPSA